MRALLGKQIPKTLVLSALELLCMFHAAESTAPEILESGLFETMSDAHIIIARHMSILYHTENEFISQGTCEICMSSYLISRVHVAEQ